MSYWDITEMSNDADLRSRVAAAAAQEQTETEPWEWVSVNMLRVTAAPGWDAAWASAQASSVDRPGKDPGVISDGQILSSVQLLIGT